VVPGKPNLISKTFSAMSGARDVAGNEESTASVDNLARIETGNAGRLLK